MNILNFLYHYDNFIIFIIHSTSKINILKILKDNTLKSN